MPFGPKPRPLADRLWEKVVVGGPDECWEFQGARAPTGYGKISSRPEDYLLAHRAMWIVTFGPIPPGRSVLHRCDNPPCVNPAHLYVGSASDNMHDAAQRTRTKGYKLTAAQRVEVIQRYLAGEAGRALATEFGVSAGNVEALARRHRRRRIGSNSSA
jgi:hypothetical protein